MFRVCLLCCLFCSIHYTEATLTACIGLPTISSLTSILQDLVDTASMVYTHDYYYDYYDGGGELVVTILDHPHYTCQVNGSVNGSYQELSLIVEYYLDYNIADVRVRQIELVCGKDNNWITVSSASTPLLDTTRSQYSSIDLLTNCTFCTDVATNVNHCLIIG